MMDVAHAIAGLGSRIAIADCGLEEVGWMENYFGHTQDGFFSYLPNHPYFHSSNIPASREPS